MNGYRLFLLERLSVNMKTDIGASSALWLSVRFYGIESEEEGRDSLCQELC